MCVVHFIYINSFAFRVFHLDSDIFIALCFELLTSIINFVFCAFHLDNMFCVLHLDHVLRVSCISFR